MTKKQMIRGVIFLALLIGILWWIDHTFRFDPDRANLLMTRRFNEMYTDEKNTWDGIMIGSSNADRAWAAPAAWEECGITVYPMSTDGGPFVLLPNIIEEVMKRQDISFAVVDLHGLSSENINTNPVKVRRVTDNMKRSLNWLDTIDKGVKYLEKYCADSMTSSASTLRMSYYFPIIQFHSRLMTGTLPREEDLFPGVTQMKGVYSAGQSFMTNHIHLDANEVYPDVTKQQKELLDALFQSGKAHGIELIFLNVATDLEDESETSINAAVRYVQENGYTVLDCNNAETLAMTGLDADTDFFDQNHMNALGANKFTRFLCGWLKENLQTELVDHRGDKRYASWDAAADYYDDWYTKTKKQTKKWKKQNGIYTIYPEDAPQN